MCYRCEVCTAVVETKQPLLRHLIYRSRQPLDRWGEELPPVREIEREMRVCSDCSESLKRYSLKEVLQGRSPKRELIPVPGAEPPPPPQRVFRLFGESVVR